MRPNVESMPTTTSRSASPIPSLRCRTAPGAWMPSLPARARAMPRWKSSSPQPTTRAGSMAVISTSYGAGRPRDAVARLCRGIFQLPAAFGKGRRRLWPRYLQNPCRAWPSPHDQRPGRHDRRCRTRPSEGKRRRLSSIPATCSLFPEHVPLPLSSRSSQYGTIKLDMYIGRAPSTNNNSRPASADPDAAMQIFS